MKIFILSFLVFISSSTSWANPVNMLEDHDRDYYIRIFDYVMEYSTNANPYPWKANQGTGTISVGRKYMSKQNVICRDFYESYLINKQAGTARGAGCKREKDKGWCKIRENDPRTCALENRTGDGEALDKASEYLKNADELLR